MRTTHGTKIGKTKSSKHFMNREHSWIRDVQCTSYTFDAQKSEANQNKNTKNWHCQFGSEQNTIKI